MGRTHPEQYRALFRKSAVKRAKFEGVKRNIAAALENFEPLENQKPLNNQ